MHLDSISAVPLEKLEDDVSSGASYDEPRADSETSATPESAPTRVPVFSFDATGRLVRWGGLAQRLLGLSEDEAIGRNVAGLADVGGGLLSWSHVLAELAERGSWHDAGWWTCPDGSREWLSRRIEAQRSAGPDDRRAYEWVLSVRRLEAHGPIGASSLTDAEAFRLQSLGRVASGVAHDLGSIFMAIEGFADLLQSRLPPDGWSRSMLGELLHATRRGGRLSREVLDIGSLRRDARSVDIASSVLQLEPILRAITPARIDLRIDMERDLPRLVASERVIELVLLNLVANARDAINGEGSIEVLARGTAGAGAPGVTGICLSVKDSGVGIAADFHERIFDPCFSTKHGSGGTGLGLAMVLDAVRTAEGRIRLSSVEGTGTTFEVHFPVASDSAESAAVRHPEMSSGRGGGYRVLLRTLPGSRIARPVEILLGRRGFDVTTRDKAVGHVDEKPEEDVDLVLVELPSVPSLADEWVTEPQPGPGTLYLRPRSAGGWACRGSVLDLPCDPLELVGRIERAIIDLRTERLRRSH